MRYLVILFGLLITFLPPSEAQEGGIIFFEGSFEEALEQAVAQDKTIFVDAFTTWCGPCKRMKRNVFPDQSVGAFYNEHFINMAIDMETQAGRKFGMLYKVSGYPTLLYISQDGELVTKSVGAKDVERFLELGRSAIKADDRSENYAENYEKGKRDYDFMLKYISSLKKVDKPTAKIAYEYLDGDYDLSKTQRALFIYEAASSCDSKLYKMLTSKKNKKLVIQELGQEKYDQKIYELCWATVEKGFEFGVWELVEEAKDKMKKEARDEYDVFSLNADLAVAKSKYNASDYFSAAKKRIKLFDQQEDRNAFLLEMLSLFPKERSMLDYALEYSAKSLEEDDSMDNNHTYGQLLMKDFKYDEALTHLNKALEMASDNKKYNKARVIAMHRKLALQGSKRR
jgi:thiol-disulfide isomerase/thioredoxin